MAALTGKARTAETFLAGLGASGGLLAGGVIVFLLLVGMVTFDAFPGAAGIFSRDEPNPETVDASVPAEAAAAALAPATDLVASAEPGAPLVSEPGGGGSVGDGTGGATGGAPGGDAPSDPGSGPTGGDGGGGGAGNQIDDTVSNAGKTVNDTVGNAGKTVSGAANNVGQTVNNTVNTVGGVIKGLGGN